MRWITRLRGAIALGTLLGLSACMDARPIPVAPTGQSASPAAVQPSQPGPAAQPEPAPVRQPTVQEAGDPYLNLLRDRVAKYLPKDEGSTRLTATYRVGLRRDGQLVSTQIIRSSGIDRIDLLGESAIRRASPMPPVPRDFPGGSVVYFTAKLSIRSL